MEELDQVIKTASGIGALVGGAVSFAVTWGWKIWERQDSILVRFGSSHYEVAPGFALHVISRRAHRMEIVDYGFVMSTGELLSLPAYYEHSFIAEDDDYNRVQGSSVLEGLNQRFEVRLNLHSSNIVGAYARTATQKLPTVNMSTWSYVSWWHLWWAALKARYLRRFK